MTITIFATLFMIGSLVSGLLTEAIKKAFSNAGKECSPNLIALLLAVIVGVAGTISAYVLMDIGFDVKSVICIALMAISIWIGSMIGYDKVRQLIDQIGSL